MKKLHILMLFSIVVLSVMLVSACATPAAPAETPAQEPAAEEPVAEEPAPEEPAAEQPMPSEITVWSRYDINDPEDSNGATLKQFITDLEADSGTKVNYEQIAWDQLSTKLALAVQSGGDVPDIVESGSQHIPPLIDAGALMVMNDLLKDQSWAADLTDGDKKACIIEGDRYCVANNVRGGMTYYQVDKYPDGSPKTPEEWQAVCEGLKADGVYANSFFAGRSYGAIEVSWWPLIKSNGGNIFDAEGKPAWATEEVAEVAKWGQEMFESECFPAVAVTGDFSDPEIVWMDGKSAAFGGGSWSAVFVPGLLDSVNAGDVGMAGGTSFGGGDPHVFMVSEGWVIPKGAKNPEGATSFLNAFMQPEFLAKWSEAQYGIPTTNAAYAQGQIQDSPFYENVDEILGSQGAYMQGSPFYVESLDVLAVTWQELLLDPSLDPMTELQKAADEVLGRYW